MRLIDYFEIFGFFAEAGGIYLLFREVYYAHKLERYHCGKRMKEQEECDNAANIEIVTSRARLRFAGILADWLAQNEGMAIDESYIFSTEVLGLGQSTKATSLEDWFGARWSTPANLDKRARLLKFGVGLLLLVVLIHSTMFCFEVRKPARITEVPATAGVRPISPEVAFDRGQALLRYSVDGRAIDLTVTACNVKKALIATGAQEALVIGHHDQTQLGKLARETFSSNQGLAQQRAEEVRRYLTEKNSCGVGIRDAIALIAGPRVTGKRAGQQVALARDRTVEVWAIVP